MTGESLPPVRDALAARLAGRVVFVGIGNPLFGDDGAGCALARALARLPGLDVVQAEDVPESYVAKIADGAPDVVVLIDAVDFGAPAGSVAVLEREAMGRYPPSTHRVPLGLIAEFVRSTSGADVFVLGIQPGRVQLGATLGPEVSRTVDALAELIREWAAADRAPAAREVAEC